MKSSFNICIFPLLFFLAHCSETFVYEERFHNQGKTKVTNLKINYSSGHVSGYGVLAEGARAEKSFLTNPIGEFAEVSWLDKDGIKQVRRVNFSDARLASGEFVLAFQLTEENGVLLSVFQTANGSTRN